MRDPFSSVFDRKQDSVFRGDLLLCHHPLEGELHRVHLLCLPVPGYWDQRCVYHHAQQLAFFLNIFFSLRLWREERACRSAHMEGRGQFTGVRSLILCAFRESRSGQQPWWRASVSITPTALSAWLVFFMTSKEHSPLQLVFHHKIHI